MRSLAARLLAVAIPVAMSIAPSRALAQADMPSKVALQFNRYSTFEEIERALTDLARAYPELVTLKSLGKSLQGRDIWLLIVNNPKTGPDTSKPAMWIDGNIHANEIQAAEVVLYTAWYLTKAHGVNKDLTELMDRVAFYLCPVVNPDSRVGWFTRPATPNNFRGNQRPVDSDRDGLFDEDGPDDLDGDGSVTQMWKRDPAGQWTRNTFDSRVFRRVPPGKTGDWTFLGEEGLDNDGDGEINEDPSGGDDMNRNWPGGWLPNYVQFGAGPFPLSAPEASAIAAFMRSRPNISAAQAYHNAGGMILRGPGAQFRENFYPQGDVRVYDELARIGEQMMPYYRSLVIWKDLYTVHGGFVNWAAESLGAFSFTNELWTGAKYFQRDVADPSEEQDWIWRDKLAFGQLFTPFTEVNHPTHGPVLVGGLNKWSARSTPTFMLEEECHRNFAFTMLHAGEMPRLSFSRTKVEAMGEGLWAVTVEVRNEKLIPTRSEVSRRNRIGAADVLMCEPAGGTVVSSDRLSKWDDRRGDDVRHEPGRVRVESGVPSRGRVVHRFIVSAPAGSKATLTYRSPKAMEIRAEVELKSP